MRRSFKVITLTTILLAFAISAPGQTRRQQFNPDGSFWIIGEHPTGFVDFGGINLNGRRLRHIPSQGLQLMNGTTFYFKSLTVKRNDFRFTTVTRSGVYYTFAGRFLRGGVYAELALDDEQPVLEGVLTKYERGKKVVDAKLKFSYFGGT
ncbi:MAG TPA: hypothetical protein VK893_10175 [Pyrinomonadaceae bacterium]|nr:hypothetical protein [Pyrinomonadaceae bacterium]